MSANPTSNDPACSSSSLRKRQSPSIASNTKRELEPSGAAASAVVQSAAHPKQRRVAVQPASQKVPADDTGVEPTNNFRGELRFLTDFFPEETTDAGRITRSRIRRAKSPPPGHDQAGSPAAAPEADQADPGPGPSSSSSNTDGRKARNRRGGKPKAPINEVPTVNEVQLQAMEEVESDRSYDVEFVQPTIDVPEGVVRASTVVTSSGIAPIPSVRLESRIVSSAWDAIGLRLDDHPGPSESSGETLSDVVVRHIGELHPRLTAPHALGVGGQIPVIQSQSGSGIPGVPISLGAMLFDPLSQAPSTSHSRGISRSTASQLFHGLMPRMQQFLGGHRPVQQDSRTGLILEGLRSDNELRQIEAATELAEWLLMASEDNLPAHMPVRELTHALITLLQMEHNFELMLTAARCLRNMLEAVPRSQPIVIEAVPHLLEKLKRIECVDVAEQALTVLEELSKRNAKTILSAGGIAACISHVDFFSLASQRLAFSIAANCASYLSSADFALVKDSLPDLTERLLVDDKRCLESVCQLFGRLVENLRNHPDKLREIAGANYRLLALVKQHLMAQPSQLSSSTFTSVIKMLRCMASRCPDVAVALIRMDYDSTFRVLFTGTDDKSVTEIMERPPNQLQDMVFLVGELFPRLPTTGIFEIDSAYLKSPGADGHWFWQDDHQQWQPFRSHENRILEAARGSGQFVYDLAIENFIYRMDLDNMKQRNLSTGKERPLQRRVSPAPKERKIDDDQQLNVIQEEPALIERVVQTLFPILVAIDSSSCGPALRFECLRVMLRMICPISANTLRVVLADLPLSGHIASALASPRSKDLSIVVAALQMVHLLLEKMSDIYAPLFRKEGVAHEVQKLAATALAATKSTITSKSAPSSATSSPNVQNEHGRVTRSQRARNSCGSSMPSTSGSSSDEKTKKKETSGSTSSSTSRTRKRGSPDGSPAVKKEKESRRKSSNFLNALRIPGIGRTSSGGPTSPGPSSSTPSSSNTSAPPTPPVHHSVGSFIAQIVAQQSHSGTIETIARKTESSAVMNSSTKERLREWIRKEAELLLKTYLSDSGNGGSVIDCLSWVAQQLSVVGEDIGTNALKQLHDILKDDSVSAFEMTHSGVISALHNYLVSEDANRLPPRKLRLKRFAAIFMHLTADHLRPVDDGTIFSVFEALVSKVLASVAQTEQFQVKVNDMGGIATGSAGCLRGAQALKFFQSHQIKCSLRRHPSCRDLKDYYRHGGSTIKVDPFTAISAIERYLVDKGIGRPKGAGDESSGEDMSDDDEIVNNASPNDERRIELLIGDTPLPLHMSVLQALRQFSPHLNTTDEHSSIGNGLWMTTHTLYYRSANQEGAESSPSTSSAAQIAPVKEKKHKISDKLWLEGETEATKSPLWLFLEPELPHPIEDPCVPSLLLLRALHGLNRYWHGLFDDEPILPTTFTALLSASSFHSNKLAAKLQRQLTDFISVATQQIPPWTTELVKAVPFLFPFNLRRSLLYCTAFGRERALMHLVSQSEGVQGEGESSRLTPRLERRKIVVRRDDLLRTAELALANNACARAMLEVSFDGEAGTGFGPTLEFYSTVSRELQNAVHKMWHGGTQKDNGDDDIEFVIAGHGLYPIASPHSQRRDAAKLRKFETLGRLMGQALVDCRMLDLPLSPVFLHWLVSEPNHLSVAQMEMLDPQLYQSLRSLTNTKEEEFEYLEQYFTLPGNENFELMKNGRNIPVNKSNVHRFIKLASYWRLAEGVWREMEAVKRGFSQVLDPSQLSLFLPEELDQLFCGCSDAGEKVWGESVIAQAIKPDHGYTHDSEQIRWLIQMLAGFSQEDQRKFVQFVTGSPRLPVGGFRALNPPLTVVKKTASYGSGDEELPSAMTCYNYLKIPAYSTYDVFCQRFAIALQHIYSFHLT